MNVASILTKAYNITNTNVTTFLDGNATNVLANLNTEYGHRTLRILKVRQDLNAQIKEVITDLISTSGLSIGDVGYNGEYPFESDTMRPVRLEVSYDGVTWMPCMVYDLNESGHSEHDSTSINDTFSTDTPQVRFERDSYFIRPLKTTSGNITAGIHLWTEKRQTDLTTGSPDFEQNLHDVLAYDLAELETIMHSKKYDEPFMARFYKKQSELNTEFDGFLKNRFKRNFVLKSQSENYR